MLILCIFANMPQHFTYTQWYNTYFMTSSVEFQFDKGKLHTRRYLLLAFETCVRICVRLNGCWCVQVCMGECVLCCVLVFVFIRSCFWRFVWHFENDTVGLVFETQLSTFAEHNTAFQYFSKYLLSGGLNALANIFEIFQQ